mgnify:CR=1 FL=1
MRVDRSFSVTQLPPDTAPALREVIQAMAQAIDQLTNAINHVGFATSLDDMIPGTPAGNFNATFLSGRITAANQLQRFTHMLGRVPIGCLEVLTTPRVDASGPLPVVAGALAVGVMDGQAVQLMSSTANKFFTVLLF